MKKQFIRLSNRVYLPKGCKHCTEDFTPTDARQEFCCAQHRIDYNNDKRQLKNVPIKKIIAGLTKNEEILKKAYLFMKERKKDTIAFDFLQYDGYDSNIPCESSKSNSGNIVQWQLSYGLEGFDLEKKLFKIHKR